MLRLEGAPVVALFSTRPRLRLMVALQGFRRASSAGASLPEGVGRVRSCSRASAPLCCQGLQCCLRKPGGSSGEVRLAACIASARHRLRGSAVARSEGAALCLLAGSALGSTLQRRWARAR